MQCHRNYVFDQALNVIETMTVIPKNRLPISILLPIHIYKIYIQTGLLIAHTTEDNRHPMEGTEGSTNIRESFKKENAEDWTKGMQEIK